MFENEKLKEKKPGIYHAMGDTAETVAKRYNVTRESQDEYALSSRKDAQLLKMPAYTMMKLFQ